MTDISVPKYRIKKYYGFKSIPKLRDTKNNYFEDFEFVPKLRVSDIYS